MIVKVAVSFPQNLGPFLFGGLAQAVNVASHFHLLAQGKAADMMNDDSKIVGIE